jgi:hypothetical protein
LFRYDCAVFDGGCRWGDFRFRRGSQAGAITVATAIATVTTVTIAPTSGTVAAFSAFPAAFFFARSCGAALIRPTSGALFGAARYFIDVFGMLVVKVGYIEERVTFQSQVHEGGLHTGKHPGYTSLVDASSQRILVGSLEKNFHKLIVFHDRQPRFVAGGRDHQFFTAHALSPRTPVVRAWRRQSPQSLSAIPVWGFAGEGAAYT